MELKFIVYGSYINKCKAHFSLLTDTVCDCMSNNILVPCKLLTTQYCIDNIAQTILHRQYCIVNRLHARSITWSL